MQDNSLRPRRQGSALGLWLKLWAVKIVAVIVVLAAVALAVRHYAGKVPGTSSGVSITADDRIDLTPTQISSIERIGEWSFLEISDEELVDTVRKGFFSDDELVRIYYGTLRLGINTREAHEGWLHMDGDTLRAVLPPVRLLDSSFIDETRTRSFIETGRWTHQDRKAMYDRAALRMRRRCLTPANLQAARDNARAQFGSMLRSMGFDNIDVRVSRD